MAKLKALYALQCIEWIREEHGPSGVARVQAAMDPAACAAVYSPTLVATDWVDVAHALDHALAVDRVFSLLHDREASDRMLCALVAKHYNGLYKPLFAGVATPLMVLEKSSRLWGRFYDAGESVMTVNGPTSVVKRIVGCPDMPRQHDVLTKPYYEELLRQSGARSPNARHSKCVATGSEFCETVLSWRE